MFFANCVLRVVLIRGLATLEFRTPVWAVRHGTVFSIGLPDCIKTMQSL